MSIYRIHAVVLAGILLAVAPATAQVSEQNFRGGKTSDLAALCGASPQDPLGPTAIAWCHGFMVAAGQYHAELSASGGVHQPIFCLPNPTPTLDEARASFVAWARSNPQHANERAIDGLMRFATQAYPCPRPESGQPRRR
jgi:hypothetical protein